MEIGIRYKNIITGKIGVVVEYNKKFKTVILEFGDGTALNIDTSTLKKQYISIQ